MRKVRVIGIQFTVKPPNIGNETNVKFDISRRREVRTWRRNENTGNWIAGSEQFPVNPEFANDDTHNNEESPAPNSSNRMYSSDHPGVLTGGVVDDDIVVSQGNLQEFIRVVFEGTKPEGNGVQGSRASDYVNWYARSWVEMDANGDWHRNTGDAMETDTNDIGEGHIVLGTGAQP